MKNSTPATFLKGFHQLAVVGLLFSFVLLSLEGFSQVRYSVATGNWSNTAVWSATSGGAGGASVPAATDIVIIERGFNVTVNIPGAVCSILQLGTAAGGGNSGNLTFNAGSQLTVSGAVNLGITGQAAQFGTVTMTAGGTLVCTSIASNSTGDNFVRGLGTIQLTATNSLPVTDAGNEFGSFTNLVISGGTTTLTKNIVTISGTLTVSGGTFSLGAFNIANVGAVSMTGTTISGAGTLTLGGNVSTNGSATPAVISAPLSLGAAARTFTVANGAADPDLETSSAISAAFGVIKAGPGVLELSGPNSNNGGTLSAGTMRFSSTSPLGVSGNALALNGGILEIAIDGVINTYNTTVGGATTIVSNRATSGAGINHTLGTLSIGAFQLSQTVGANVTSGIAGLVFGATTLTAGGSIYDIAANANLALGALTGNLAFSKQNSGQLTLNTASARAGGTVTLDGGVLHLGIASALGTAAVPLTLNGGTLDLAINATVNAHPTTVGAGPVTIMSDRSTAGAGITHTLGTLSIGSGQLNLTSGANVSSGIGGLTFGATTLTASPIFDTDVNTALTLGALAGNFAFSKQNSGQLTMNTASARISGAVTVNAGELQLGIANALGTTGVPLVLNSGILDLAINATVNAYNTTVGGAVTIFSNKATAATAGITHTLGTLTIGANTLTIDQGTNVSGGAPAVQFSNVTMTGAPVFSPAAGVSQIISGTIAGAFKLTKSGAGTLQKLTTGWTLPADFEVTAGIYNSNGQTTTVTGLTTISGGTYQASTALQTFNGGLTISGGTFSGSTGGVTTTDVALSSGTLTAPSGTFNVSGNWNRTGGTFTPGLNTVTFNSGAGTQTLNSGGAAFNNITHSAAGTLQLVTSPLSTAGIFSNSLGTFDANGLAHTVTGQTALSGGNYLASTALQSLNGGLSLAGGTFTGSSGAVSTSNVLLTTGTLIAPTGSFDVSANWTNNGGTFTHSSGNVNFNGAAQAIAGSASTPFFNLSTSGASVTSINTTTTIANNLAIRNGTAINVASFPFTVNGTTTVGGGASGTLTFSNATGPNTFGGLVTVASGATWDNTINAPMFFKGGITNSGTFTAGTTALYTFDTNPQSLTGILSIPNVTVTGVTLINNNTLTVGTALSGSGILFQAATGILNLGGTSGIALLSASNAGNLVNFNGASQTINPISYHHLTVNQSGGVAVLSGPTSANGTLTLTAGGIDISGNTLTLGPSATVGGAPSSTNMIIASSGGELRKQYSGVGSFQFPVGDNTGTAEYSPITINVTSGSFSSAYIGVSVVDAKHPSDASTTDYLDRYWNVIPSGITTGVATITAAYPGGDLIGALGNVAPAKLTGTFNQFTNPWTKDAGSIASPFTIAGVSIPSGQPTVFTGITRGNPTAAAGTDKTICNLASVMLGGAPTATGGVGSFGYSWSPATGLSATNVANPVFTASSTGTTTYTVTVTDSNGAIGTDQVDVIVSAIPAQPVPTTPGPFVQCVGTGNILLTSNTPAGTASYQWYKGGVLIGGATSISYTVIDLVANSGNYTVTAIGAGPTLCASIQSAPISVTINPLPSVTPPVSPATTTICNGATVTVTVTGSETGINYEVFDGVTSKSGVIAGTGGNINIVTSALTASATLTVRATNPVTSCTTLLTGTVGVTVNPIPAQPVPTTPGPFVQCVGTGNILLTSNTPAGTASYQWYKGGVLIGGATSISYTVIDLVANSGNYTVTAIGAGPTLCTSIQSAPISVTINPLPSVTPPVGPATTTICSGTTVTVSVTGSEAGINYEVFDGVTSVSSVVAGTGGLINIVTSALTTSTTLSVRATNPVTSCTTLLTGTVGVTVNPIPAQPVPTTPGPFVQCLGTGNILLTSNTPAGTATYQWYKGGVLIGGATSISYSVIDLVANSGNYTVTAIGAGPTLCASIQSAAISVTINPLPSVTPPVSPATTTICNGATVTVTVTGSEAGINYQVFDGVTPVSGVIAGTGGAINLVTSALSASTTLGVRATNPATSCSTALTGTVGVTVNPIPAQPVPTTSGPFVQCVGTGNILLTSNTPAGTASYQWYKGGVLIGGATSISYSVIDLVANSGNYTVTAIGAGPTLCASIQSAPISVTINPLPSVTPPVSPATTTICNGATVTVTVTGSETGINYEVFDGVTSKSGVIAGTGGNINIVTSALTASATLTVRATNPVTSCTTLLTGTVGVTVNPIPAQPVPTTPGPFVQCVGTGNILLTSNTPAGTASYQWYKGGVLIGGATSITYTVIDLVANSGNYTVTAIGAGPTLCTSIQSAPISVTINPLPSVTPPVGPATTTICSGTTVAVSVTGSEAGINYEVFDGVTSVSSVVAGTGGLINIVTSALTTSTTLSVRATNPVTSCTTLLTGTVGVTVNPIPATPTVNPLGPVVICQGTGAVTLTSSSGSGNQWYKNGGILAGQTAVTLVISDVPASSGGYTVVVTQLGCSSLASITVAVTVNPIVTANAGTTPVTVCEGTAVTLGGSPTGGGGNGSYTFGWTSVPAGFTSSASNPPVTPAVGSTTYSVLVTDGNGCTATANKVVNVSPVPVVAAVPNQAGCPATAQPQINFTSTTDPGTSYNWSVSNFAALGLAAGAGSTDNIPGFTYAANATAVDITGLATVTANESGCFSTPVTFTITLHPKPILTPVSDINVCPGNPVNVNFGVDVVGTLISWTNSDPTIGLAATGNGDISFSALSAQPIDVVADLSTTASKDGCTSNPVLFKITVKPFPTLTITNALPAFCTGGTTDITLDSPTTGAVITLNSVFYNGATGGAFVGGETFVDNDQILETLSNASTEPVTVVYQFTVAAGICLDPTIQSVSVTVNPDPVLSSTLSPPAICSGVTNNFSYAPTSATSGATFGWVRTTQASISEPGTTGSGAVLETLTNTTSSPVVVPYQFTTTANGCSTIQNVLLTVNPTPVLTSTVAPAAICSGTVFNYTATSSTPGATFSWSRALVGGISEAASAGAANVSETLTNTMTAAINVTYVYVVSANGCTNPSSYNVVVSVKPSPVLNSTLTPADICSGATFNYTGTSATASPTFAWTRALVGGISEAANSGATAVVGETLTNTTTAPVNVTYVFIVTAAGCAGPPQNVVVTVNPNPVLSSTLTPSSICSTATFNYTATSATVGATFAWSRASVGGITPATSSGATGVISEALTSSNTTPTVVTYQFTTSRLGCSTIQNVLLTVNPTPVLTSTVAPAAICSGTVFNYTATSSTPGATFSWSRALVGGISEAASAGAANVSETLTNTMTAAINVTYVYVVSANGCTNPSSYNVVVSVKPSPVLNSTLTPADICSGATFNYTGTSATASPTFAWTRALVGGISEAANSGATAVVGETLTNTTTAPVNVTYVFIVTAAGCAGPPQNVVVTVNPNPVLSSTLTPSSICSTATFNYTATSATVGATFAWSRASVGGITPATSSGATGVISEALTSSNTTPTVVTYQFTTSRLGCSTIQNVLLTVNPTPVLTSTVAPAAICSGTVFNYTATSSTPGATFSWSRALVGGISEAASAGAANVSETLTNTMTAAINVTYVYVVSANGCTNPSSYNVVVSVKPSPVLNSTLTPADICSGATFNYTGTSATASPTFAWTRALVGGISEAANSGATAVVGETLTNTTTAPVNVTYVFIVTAAGCAGPAQNVVVTVNPNPVLSSTLTPSSICSTATFNYTATSATVGATFAWSRASVGGITPATSSGATGVISEALTSSNTTPTVVTYQFTTSRLGCSTIQNVLLTVNPTPVLTSTVAPAAICSGTVFNYTATSSTPGATFSWSRALVGGISEAASAGAANVSETLTNTMTAAINVTYVYVVSANGCTNPSSYNVVVSVKPSPVLNSTLTPADICSGATFNYTGTSATASPTFAWTRALVGGISEAANSGATAVVGETLTNTTTAPVNVTYVFIVTAAGCAGPAQNVVVTVNPNPVLSSTLTPSSICSTATFNYTATSATVGATFAWSRASVGGITPATSSGATGVISEALTSSNTTPTVVTYQFTTSRLGCSTIQNVLLTVNPTPVLTSTVAPAAICSGTVFNYTATSSTPGATFSWSRALVGGISEAASAGAANVSETLTNTMTAAINVTYVYVVSANGCTNPSSYNVVVSVKPSPVLNSTLTPADICSGATFNYTGTSATASPTFAWTRALVGGISEAANSGATAVVGETLTNTTTAPVNVTYVFIVTAAGCAGPPQNVVVTVNPNPVLSSTLTPSSICSTATFNYTATSATVGATFAWSRASVGGITPATSSGATGVISEALTSSNTTPTVVTYQFTTSRLGCSTIQNVLLTVNPTPVLTSTVAPAAICSGTVFNYTATSSTPGATFSWSRALVGGISEAASAGAANVSETLTNTMTAAINVTYVYVVSANGCTNPSSYNVVVSVKPSPVLNSTLTPADICSGATFNYTGTSATASPTFAWTRALVGGISEAANSGATAVVGETLTNTTTAPVNVTYVFIVTAAGCAGPAQNVVVTVNPNPVLSSTLTPSSICSTATFNYTATSATVGATFAWSRASVGGITPATSSGATGVISEALTSSNTTPTVVTYQFTTSRLGCSTIQNVLLTVNPTPVLTSTVAPAAICSGTVFNYTATSSTPGATFSWSRALVGGISEAASAGAANVSETLTNTMTAAINVTYVYVVSANGCTNPSSYNVVVSVKPSPILNSTLTPADICSGATFNYTGTSATASPTFAWTRALVGGISEAANSGATAVVGETLTNTTTAPVNVTYVFIVTAAGCAGPAQNVVVTVNPNPVLSSTLTPSSICSTATFNYTATSATVGATFAWSRASVGGITPATSSGATGVISEALTSSNTTPTVVTYQFTTSRLGCSTIQNVLLTVNPTPVLTSTVAPAAICSGTVFNYTATSSTPGATFSWSRALVGGISEAASAGAANVSETLTNTMTAAINVTYVYVVSANGCTNPSSYNVVVSVQPNASFAVSNVLPAVCEGIATNIGLSSSTTGERVTLISVVAPGSVAGYTAAGTQYNSLPATIADVLSNSSNSPQTVTYTFEGSLGGTCINPIQQVVVVTVNPAPPDLSIINALAVLCEGTPNDITLNSVTANAIITLTNVQYNGATGTLTNGTTFTPGSKVTESLGNSSSGPITVNYTFQVAANGCTNPSTTLTSVQVKPEPVFSIVNTTPIICEATAVDITLNSPTTNAIVTLASVNYGAVIGTLSAGATYTNGQKITEVLNNPTNLGVTVTYIFDVRTNTPAPTCSSPVTRQTTVIVKPSPSANGTDITICSGQNAIIPINPSPENVAGTTYDWTLNASANVTGATNDNGSLINQTITLTDFNVGTIQYHVTPTANGCVGPVKDLNVTVNPIALVNAGIDYQVCEPATIPLSGTIGGAATSGTWAIITGAGSISASSTVGTTVTATYTVNPSDISTTLVFRLQTNDPDVAGPCSAVSDQVNVQVNRMPFVSVPADYVVCEPVSYIALPIHLTGTIGGSATTGLWSVVTGNGGLSATSISGATVSADYVIDPSDVGTIVTFRLTTNDPDGPGPCVALFDDINITINLRATVDAGPDLELCSNTPSIALQGSFGGSTIAVLWSGGTGTFSNASNPTSNYNWNNPPELNTNITLTLTALDPDGVGPCNAVADQMVLTINPLPVVFFSGLPPGSPPNVAENTPPITLVGNQQGGLFTIAPATSNIGSTVQAPGDQAVFDPSAVTIGVNTITYTYTDTNGCTNLQNQPVIVNPVTSATFAIQNGSFNSLTLAHEVCAEQGDLLLTGNPDFNTFGPNQFIASAGLTINQSGSPGSFVHTISTNGLPAGTYTIDYVYTNAFGATSHNTFAVKIFAAPVPVIQVNNSCIVAAIQFRDFSYLPATNPYPATISSWLWDFDDNQLSTLQNPDHVYSVASLYDVNLKVTTTQGCTQNVTKQIRVGDVPIVDFAWSAICNNDQTKFQDLTNPGSVSVITTYAWDFGDGNMISGPPGGTVSSGGSTGIYEKPDHNYAAFGSYNAQLTVSTNDGCSNSLTKRVFILPYTTVVPAVGSAYTENFEASNGGWVEEAFYAKNSTPINIIPSDTSWVYGTPGFNKFTPYPGSPKAWWTGKDVVNKTYFPYENSAVNGPCFNLNQLKRPMIAIDYWSDTQRGIDGTTLQYSVDAGITWRIIGPAEGLIDRDQGINWFNGTGISANPGNQSIGQYGWTDRSEGWKNARFNLDMIPSASRSQVRIRIALGTNDSNPANENYDGFAFDNVYVGEKQRNVLVEHFTNASLQASVDGDTYINTLYQDQIIFRGASDFYDIQYHISSPGNDALNADNVADPGARSTYMGVSQPPKSIMDGILVAPKFTGKYTDMNMIELDRRALVEPMFDLQLDTLPTGDKNKITVRLTMTAKQAINTPLIAQVALLENQTGTFKNVLRKHLFGADGETITVAFSQGLVLVRQRDNINLDVPLTNPGQLTLVGYVQDKNTKEILQSVVKAAPYKRGTIVVGLEDAAVPTTLNGISMYPNPANGHFYLGLPETGSSAGFEWKLIDQRGVTVRSGDFENSINNTKQVQVNDLANGVYFVMLAGPGGSVVHRKLVILNRN